MRLILNVLVPKIYELLSPGEAENIVFISHPDPLPGSEDLWEIYKDSELWRNSRCLGIDFKDKLESRGYVFEDYTRDVSYTLSGEATRALMSDLKNYPEITVFVEEALKFGNTDKTTLYEFTKKSDGSTILLVNPSMEELEMSILPCVSVGTYEIEVPGQAAVDYYTSDGFYVLTEDRFSEVLMGLKVPEELRNLEFYPDRMILRWEGLLKDNTECTPKPWRVKLENLKGDINKVLESRLCMYLKEKKIKRLIESYYGKI